ncbi:MAG: hypothetical protein KBB11_00765 [Bacteroidales bacterium]|nr:hypothetical protein [Bacteroidales bacterium]HOY38674.1 hypothetical protein [Bacteroidales bacterium]HQP04039.1 hypothetical protein [Bacteroidales bacterium]
MNSQSKYLYFIALLILLLPAGELFSQQTDTVKVQIRKVVYDTVFTEVEIPVYDTVYKERFISSLSFSPAIGAGVGVNRFGKDTDSTALNFLNRTYAESWFYSVGTGFTATSGRFGIGTGVYYTAMDQKFIYSHSTFNYDTITYYNTEIHLEVQTDTVWFDSINYQITTISNYTLDSVPYDSVLVHTHDTSLNYTNRYRMIRIPLLLSYSLIDKKGFVLNFSIGPVLGIMFRNDSYSLGLDLYPVKNEKKIYFIPYIYGAVGLEYAFCPGISLGCDLFCCFPLKSIGNSSGVYWYNIDNYGVALKYLYYF